MIGQLQTDKSNKGLFKDEKSIGTICVLKENVSAHKLFINIPMENFSMVTALNG